MTGAKYKHTLKSRPRQYAAKKGLRRGSKAYNAYVYGTASRRFAAMKRKRRK